MQINNLIKKAHKNAVEHGFWDDWEYLTKNMILSTHYTELVNNALGNRLMLINGEVAEAHEALRKDDAENLREELADIAIRLFDLCGGLDIDLEYEIEKKMTKNASRPYKHGKAF